MQKIRDIPPELLTTPSPLINEFIAHVNSTSSEFIPQFSLYSSLVFFSHLYGRQYIGETGLQLGLYGMVCGKSGIGKNYIKNCLQSFNILNTYILSGATSDAGLFTALVRNPSLLIISDEIGDRFNSKNEMNKSYWRMVKDAYNIRTLNDQGYSGRVNGELKEKGESYDIEFPCLSMLGLTTPDQLIGGLTENDIKGGAVNRFTIVDANPDEVVFNDNTVIYLPPNRLCEQILSSGSNRELNATSFGNKTYSKIPELKPISITAKDKLMLKKLKKEILFDKNSDYKVRVIEKARKVAYILATSVGLKVVPESFLKWSLDLEDYWAYNTKKISQSVGGNDYASAVKKIIEFIRSRNEKGLEVWKLRKFCRESVGWQKHWIDSLILELKDDKFIEIIDGPKSLSNGKSKKLVFYIGDKRK